MTDVSYLVSTIIPLIIVYAGVADKIVKQPFKESFVRYLNRSSDDNSYYMAVRSFEAVLGHQFVSLRFFFRSLLLSLAFISIFSLYKYLWDPAYAALLKSALFSPSSIISCVLIVLIGTLISDWICFGKSLFFVQLFNIRRNFFAVAMLATADLCLTALIYAVVTGFATAASFIVFDITMKKNVRFSVSVYPHFEYSPLDYSPLEPPLHLRRRSANEFTQPPDSYLQPQTSLVDIKWIYYLTPEADAWIQYIGDITGSADVGITSRSFTELKAKKLEKDSIQAYVENELGKCHAMTYNIQDEALWAGDMKLEFNRIGGIKEHKSEHLTTTNIYANVDVEIDRLISLESMLDLWGAASAYFLLQYTYTIQSAGLVSIGAFPLHNTYNIDLFRCHWVGGIINALRSLFTVALINNKPVERFSLPIGGLPYTGLVATIFLYGMALYSFIFSFMGRMLLPRIKLFDLEEYPFTIVATIGSLLTLVLFFAIKQAG